MVVAMVMGKQVVVVKGRQGKRKGKGREGGEKWWW